MVKYNTCSDLELLLLVQEDNRNAFEEIYARFYGLLYVHAHRKLGDSEVAQDIVQDIFVSLWKNRSVLKLESPLSAYLYAAIRYKVINVLSKQKHAQAYLDSLANFLETDRIEADHLIREKQLQACIEKEIQALPPAMRRIFMLSRFEQLSHKEIAEKLDLSEQTVRTQVKNALRILRKRLGLFTYLLFLLKF